LKKEALAQEIATRRQVYRSMLESSQESRNAQTSVKVIEPASESAASANPWTGLAIGLPTTLFGGFLFFFSRKRARELSAAVAHAEVVPETAPKSTEAPTANQIIAVTNMAAGFTHPEILHDFIESLMTLDSRMLVIDCEIGGAFTTAVGLKGAPGLSDFLEQPPSERPMLPVWKSTRDGVLIMPAGTKPHRIPGLLSRHAATSEAIGYLRNGGFAHIVINAPSILTAGEMRHLTPLVDGLVLVTPSENSKDLPQAAVRQVEEYGGRILGVIADAPAAKHAQAA
jgi:Mrp family chromosome partitioning ATPase